jgi:hypothetical protein
MNMSISYIVVSTIASGAFGMYLGLSLHELTHYTVSKLAGANASIETGRFYLPHQVVFEDPEELSTIAIRIATGLVVIYPVSLIIFLWLSGLPSSVFDKTVFFVLVGASVVSPADLLGMLYPNQWQEYANNYSGESHTETLQILIDRIVGRGERHA